MISNTKIIFIIIAIFISFGMPILLGIYFCKKYKATVKSIVVGAVVFLIFQIFTRMPLLSYLQNVEWYKSIVNKPMVIALFLGVTAGLFEEIGRFIGFKFFLKDRLNWKNGVACGVGHGGIEAIVLVGIANINNLIYSLMINNGTFDEITGSKISHVLSMQIKNQLIYSPNYYFLVGGIERIFAISIHIALSLIVLYAVKNRKSIYLFVAILLHAVLDTPVAYMVMKGISIVFIEAYTLIFAIAALVFIIKVKQIDNDNRNFNE
ncbi:YhfC family intramembrane metalloprotease [Haloimpatiens sp. FM7330]|uniref:YhfC family intramembrane metalloprotease n=1 Tax=Haloimpatiens sp. FM7330 TaxID=3298610 RepID=UPI00362A3BB8